MLACKTTFSPSDTPNHMKINRSLKSAFYSCLCIFSVLLVWAGVAHCQVQVSIAPPLHQKFSDNNGVPMASGFLYSYIAGTTTLQATYVDSSGTIQNPNPIPLDSTGAPSNGSVQTQIWILNQAYKFCAYNAALVLQWCSDDIQGQLELLNLSNEWPFQQTFDQPIVITQVDNQIVLGSAGVQTTLDFPPPTGPITLHFPNSTNDTMVGRATTDTLLNKNLTVPQINGIPILNTPGTYENYVNAGITGTGINQLAVFNGASNNVTIMPAGTTKGIIGICVANCGISGSATIEETGQAFCNFDGAATIGDYVQASAGTIGACTDAGAAYPLSGQIIGRVVNAIFSAGATVIDLFGPEIQPAAMRTVLADGAFHSVNGNVTTVQTVNSTGVTTNSLNAVNKAFRITLNGHINPASGSINSFAYLSMTGATAQQYASQTAATTAWDTALTATCIVQTAGATGTVICTPVNMVSGAGSPAASAAHLVFNPVNLTGAPTIGFQCSFSSGSTSNTCSSDVFALEQLN